MLRKKGDFKSLKCLVSEWDKSWWSLKYPCDLDLQVRETRETPDSQPPGWPPVVPASWCLCLYVVSSHIRYSWPVKPTGHFGNDGVWLPKGGHKGHCSLHLSFSQITCSGERSLCIVRMLKQLYESPLCQGNEASCYQPCEWAIMEANLAP